MRILVVIPHFCRRSPGGFYGSELDPPEMRGQALSRCIASLHQTFGPRQALYGPAMTPCNTALAAEIEVVVVTTGDDHAIEHLPRALFEHCVVDTLPRHLGFACQQLMRARAGGHDWFGYVEDDIAVADPLLFMKLGWFQELFGPSALLQPNRFEVACDLSTLKMYVDGDLTTPCSSGPFQDVEVRRYLEAEAFGQPVRFQRVANPHAGCFFVTRQQLGRMAQSPLFGEPSEAFIGPLESAATLMIMRSFDVYKPARENAGFLEVQHLARRFLFDNAGGA